MSSFTFRALFACAGALLAVSACNGGGAVPPQAAASQGASAVNAASPADTTSILKLLKKDVVIGSTVDPKNGDEGPRGISLAATSYGKIKKGQLMVCNFEDSSGGAGNGTTIELLDAAAGSKPATFYQSSDIAGCDGAAITSGDQVYATGFASKDMVWINQSGQGKKTYTNVDPLGDADAPPIYLYSPEYVFTGNDQTGDVGSLSLGSYGTLKFLDVITGFAVNKKSGWSALGPSGFSYKKKIDTLYVVDGACNAIVAIKGAGNLLEKGEIVVGKDCKTFKCKYPKSSCGSVVLSGTPLDAPEAEAILPNGNLIVANTAGGNTLVELTPSGQVLDTKVVDTSKTQGIFGLLATGTADNNTALFYTDTNDNSLHELEQ
jgi:hypothetical protein